MTADKMWVRHYEPKSVRPQNVITKFHLQKRNSKPTLGKEAHGYNFLGCRWFYALGLLVSGTTITQSITFEHTQF
jgi:hypothetical protein